MSDSLNIKAILGYSIVSLSIILAGCKTTTVMVEPNEKDATVFIESTEKERIKASHTLELAWYISQRFANTDTVNHRNNLMNEYRDVLARGAYESVKFKDLALNEEMTFRLNKIRTGTRNPQPKDPKHSAMLATLSDKLNSALSKDMACVNEDATQTCMSLAEIDNAMKNEEDPQKLLQAWEIGQARTKGMGIDLAEKIKLHNIAAQRVGFENTAEMRSMRNYQLNANELIDQLDEVWNQISPLYNSLSCYVKTQLNEKYESNVLQENNLIPAHLAGEVVNGDLGNLSNYVIPSDMPTDRSYGLQEKLLSRALTPKGLMEIGQKFHVSMGFEPIGESFYQESIFEKPDTFDVFCDGGYWWLYDNSQARVVQCMSVNEEGFYGPHNGLGLLHYDKESALNQPAYFRSMHRDFLFGAVGAMNLAISPNYLSEIGFLEEPIPENADIGYLMDLALNELSAIPYHLLINKWLTRVSQGAIAVEDMKDRKSVV